MTLMQLAMELQRLCEPKYAMYHEHQQPFMIVKVPIPYLDGLTLPDGWIKHPKEDPAGVVYVDYYKVRQWLVTEGVIDDD